MDGDFCSTYKDFELWKNSCVQDTKHGVLHRHCCCFTDMLQIWIVSGSPGSVRSLPACISVDWSRHKLITITHWGNWARPRSQSSNRSTDPGDQFSDQKRWELREGMERQEEGCFVMWQINLDIQHSFWVCSSPLITFPVESVLPALLNYFLF